MGETSKAHDRRMRDGFFDRFCVGVGIDIGCAGYEAEPDVVAPPNARVRPWDYLDGDAHEMRGLEPESFDFVYSSHLLEHLADPVRAIRRWWELVEQGGRLVLSVPHRDLYERIQVLPSRWNAEHKFFILPDRSEPPNTYSLRGLVWEATGQEPMMLRTCDAGWEHVPLSVHPPGEYSIEGAWVKPLKRG